MVVGSKIVEERVEKSSGTRDCAADPAIIPLPRHDDSTSTGFLVRTKHTHTTET